MKRKIIKWTLKFTVATLLLIGLLPGIVFIPLLLYANKTVVHNFTVYQNKPLDKEFKTEVSTLFNTFHSATTNGIY